VTFRLLDFLIVIKQERRRIVHCNLTEVPTAPWTAQQGIHAFPYDSAPQDLLRDRDSIYRLAFVPRIECLGINQKLISPRSPWQSPDVERWAGSIRLECLDRVIVFKERQPRQSLESSFNYDPEVRPHRSLDHDRPLPQLVPSPDGGKVIDLPRVEGLHHPSLRQAV
jgi:transposase InsO family protein